MKRMTNLFDRGGSRSGAGRVVITAALFMTGLLTYSVAPQAAEIQRFTSLEGFIGLEEPFIPVLSLKTVPNPVIPKDAAGNRMIRDDLVPYIADLNAAIELGKTFFWDIQSGSDNKTSCATCHNHAGSDSRTRNQLFPGPDGSFNPLTPNAILRAANYPFTDSLDPTIESDNVTGSQGVRKTQFDRITLEGIERTIPVADPVFNISGQNIRQVGKVNAPSVINAVFNHRQFHNGRAQSEFNGINPLGLRDPSAKVFALDFTGTIPVAMGITIRNASLASQAVGPALDDAEMSATGRTFPELGRKLLRLKPLGLQKVDPTDSVLGALADPVGNGLTVTYDAMIQKAFHRKWWDATRKATVNGKSYSMTEANFSLYWGLALMLYQATLVSDDTPMDQYLDSRRNYSIDPATGQVTYEHTPELLDAVVTRLASDGITVTRSQILNGLALFELPVAPPPSFPVRKANGLPASGLGCVACHIGAELTSASMQNLTGHGLEPGAAFLKTLGFDQRMERMYMQLTWNNVSMSPVPVGTDRVNFNPDNYATWVVRINRQLVEPKLPVPVAVYDAGWYNVGVRPVSDNLGLGGTDPFGKPLSWVRYFQTTLSDPSTIKVVGGGLSALSTPPAAPETSPFAGEVLNELTGLPLLAGPLLRNEKTAVDGSFKTPQLRNVEFTGPYFHNGGKATLGQVMEFYDVGGDFDDADSLKPQKSPLIVPLGLSAADERAVIAFLLALTDERVRKQQAPFDHPSLPLPTGALVNAPAKDSMVELPAVGASGGTPLQRFLNLNPFR